MFRQFSIAKSDNHTVLDSCKSDPVYIALTAPSYVISYDIGWN